MRLLLVRTRFLKDRIVGMWMWMRWVWLMRRMGLTLLLCLCLMVGMGRCSRYVVDYDLGSGELTGWFKFSVRTWLCHRMRVSHLVLFWAISPVKIFPSPITPAEVGLRPVLNPPSLATLFPSLPSPAEWSLSSLVLLRSLIYWSE